MSVVTIVPVLREVLPYDTACTLSTSWQATSWWEASQTPATSSVLISAQTSYVQNNACLSSFNCYCQWNFVRVKGLLACTRYLQLFMYILEYISATYVSLELALGSNNKMLQLKPLANHRNNSTNISDVYAKLRTRHHGCLSTKGVADTLSAIRTQLSPPSPTQLVVGRRGLHTRLTMSSPMPTPLARPKHINTSTHL